MVWALVALAACAPVPPTPPTGTVQRVAVLPPVNQTGDPLVVGGTWLLEWYAFFTKARTVPDVLATALREELARRGLDVIPAADVDAALEGRTAETPEAAVALARRSEIAAPVLLVTIERWEAGGGRRPASVIVAFDATLVDPASGAVLWSKSRPAHAVPTPGAATQGAAYDLAVRRVATEMLTWWGTGAP